MAGLQFRPSEGHSEDIIEYYCLESSEGKPSPSREKICPGDDILEDHRGSSGFCTDVGHRKCCHLKMMMMS